MLTLYLSQQKKGKKPDFLSPYVHELEPDLGADKIRDRERGKKGRRLRALYEQRERNIRSSAPAMHTVEGGKRAVKLDRSKEERKKGKDDYNSAEGREKPQGVFQYD